MQTINRTGKSLARGAVVVAVAALVGLSACGGMTPRERSTAVGAGVGAATGAVLGGGTAGTVGGAVVGGVIGNQVGKDKN